MVRRFGFVGVLMVMLLADALLAADQQVTLQNGATFVGKVSAEGANLIIDVDGAKVPVPLKDVATVTPAGAESPHQAERLLFKGLEAQALYGGDQKELGLFTEAHRLAPDDPHVAFWYARSLVNAGFGKAANEVFEGKKAEIAAAYPGIAERLAKQIQERVALESLPAALVSRLDQLANGDRSDIGPQVGTIYAAYFKVVDQDDKPVEMAAFHVSANGQNEATESFPDGYYLFRFMRNSPYDITPCRLDVNQPGIERENFTFRPATNGAANGGVFHVKRFLDSERVGVVFHVTDDRGKPLSGVNLQITEQRRYDNQEPLPPLMTSDAGQAEARLFPESYNVQIYLEGYVPTNQTLMVTAEKSPVEVNVKLKQMVSASLKVVWRGMSMSPLDRSNGQSEQADTTSGEFELTTGAKSRGNAAGAERVLWLQLHPNESSLQLQFSEQRTPQTLQAQVATWVGRLKSDAAEGGDKDDKHSKIAAGFEDINLDKIDELKDKARAPHPNLSESRGRQVPVLLPVEKGAIYVGKIMSVDQRTGQPTLYSFKILATDVVNPGE